MWTVWKLQNNKSIWSSPAWLRIAAWHHVRDVTWCWILWKVFWSLICTLHYQQYCNMDTNVNSQPGLTKWFINNMTSSQFPHLLFSILTWDLKKTHIKWSMTFDSWNAVIYHYRRSVTHQDVPEDYRSQSLVWFFASIFKLPKCPKTGWGRQTFPVTSIKDVR